MESSHDIKNILKLWKTNSHSCQSATYRRCKWLFFHSFDLSPFAVELAVNNVGVAGCSPYGTWLAGRWVFFDQAFLLEPKPSLSTFLCASQHRRFHVNNPVDKSVTKLWKDRAEGRSYWPRAITVLTVGRAKCHVRHNCRFRVKQKTFYFTRKALCGAALRDSTCPRKLWKGLWITCVHMATGHAAYGVATIDQFLIWNTFVG
ncbi:hypothetical protein A9HBioS_2241 [Pseudomonas koreensis]|uniref:Uncharacterized protein n=1 Tax=Pseudomonas koreensis TaxID=198620 RepID=A0AA94JI99_9PSED|nr:hypothetical protein A9HBioS_2241 [Pseudomonas koreensis]